MTLMDAFRIALLMSLAHVTLGQQDPDKLKEWCKEIFPMKDPGIQPGCGRLFQPFNGRMDLSIGLQTEPEKAFFSCNTGYKLLGPTTISCLKSNWEGKEPICQPVDCGPPKAPNDGRVDYTRTTFLSKAHYHCDKCATLVGTTRTTCKKSGLWSRTVPKCNFNKECPPLALPKYTHVKREDSSNIRALTVKCGERIEIRCASGFRLIGTSLAECQPNGSYLWLGEPPRCHDLKWS